MAALKDIGECLAASCVVVFHSCLPTSDTLERDSVWAQTATENAVEDYLALYRIARVPVLLVAHGICQIPSIVRNVVLVARQCVVSAYTAISQACTMSEKSVESLERDYMFMENGLNNLVEDYRTLFTALIHVLTLIANVVFHIIVLGLYLLAQAATALWSVISVLVEVVYLTLAILISVVFRHTWFGNAIFFWRVYRLVNDLFGSTKLDFAIAIGLGIVCLASEQHAKTLAA